MGDVPTQTGSLRAGPCPNALVLWQGGPVQSQRSWPLRVIRALIGGAIVAVGVVGLFVPVMPGWLFVIPGLAILASDFEWARRLLDRAGSQSSRFQADSRAAQRQRKRC